MKLFRFAALLLGGFAAVFCFAAHARNGAATLKTLYQFPGGGDGLAPWGGLVKVGDTLYGTTFGGGAYGRGTVFSIDPGTGAEKLVYSFTGGTDVTTPQVGLLHLGKLLYGVGSSGGANGYGGVYSVNPATGAETVVASFTPAMGGGSGSSLVSSDGYLYGTTYGGGTGAGYGTVFKLKISSGALTTLYSFTGGADGASPQYGVAYAKGMLYGTTTSGGTGHAGTIFAVNAATGAETTLFTFDGGAHGGDDNGGVIDVGGVLYGTASYGGSSGSGVIFSYDLSTGTESTVYNFTGGADGGSPQSTLIDVSGTLYGTTEYGGSAGNGAVFSIKLATAAETTLYSFQGGSGGAHPITPVLDVGGVLYGTDGGPETIGSNNGTVFKIVLKTDTETTLHNFVGAGPFGSPGNSALLDVAGTLYGATAEGGADYAGTLYSINPATGAETTLYSFTGGADGGVPSDALAADGSTLYGLTDLGGANQGGVIYSLDPATGAASVVYSFPAGGVRPTGTLLAVKGLLYGATEYGGTSGCGTVFAFDPTKQSVTTVYNFTCGNDGGVPISGLSYNGGTLYGSTEVGGTGYVGTVFEINIASGVETVLYNFTGAADGAYPSATPLYIGGTLYGTTNYGGSQTAQCFGGFGCGVLYSVNLTGGSFTILHTFTFNADGAIPSPTMLAVGGKLYGSTIVGGASGAGTIFSYAPAGGDFNSLYAFTGGADGGGPGSLIHVGKNFYGATGGGATFNTGTVFSLTP